MTNHKRFITKKINVLISLALSTIILLSMTVSAFASTDESAISIPEALGKTQMAFAVTESAPTDIPANMDDVIPNGNRYYYTIETGDGHGFPVTITEKQAKNYNAFRSALIGALTYGFGLIAKWAGKLVSAAATTFADNYYGTAKAKAGTYTGHVYKLTKYKVDSLTGKKTKVARGVRTIIPLGGVNCTVTKWE